MKKRVKIAVTGAAGQVSYALLFRLAASSFFPDDVILEFHLLDLPQKLSVLNGIKMELEDCAFPKLCHVLCTDDVNVAMKDVDWAILVGAVPRTAGMERKDLLQRNAETFRIQGRALNQHASPNLKVLVVGNPCNTNCLITMHNAKNIPQDRFYAMTTLDEQRARFQLANKAKVEVAAIKNLAVWGNHSATQFPDFYNATIAGKAALEVLDESWLKNDFLNTVRQRGAEVIKTKGSSSGASAANGIIENLKNLLQDTESDTCYSMACCSQGEYGVDEGLIFSFPCITKNGKVEIVKDFEHNNEFARQQLSLTLAELRDEFTALV